MTLTHRGISSQMIDVIEPMFLDEFFQQLVARHILLYKKYPWIDIVLETPAEIVEGYYFLTHEQQIINYICSDKFGAADNK
jgi:hypothetical protein